MDDEFKIKDEQKERINDVARCLFGCTLDEMREKLAAEKASKSRASDEFRTVTTAAMFMTYAETIAHNMGTLMDCDVTDLVDEDTFKNFRQANRRFLVALTEMVEEIDEALPALDVWKESEQDEDKGDKEE